MSDIIELLPDSVANQIAAGEVIQRPASVVKELMENAIDAGATQIQLIVKEAGKTLIQVIDNGCGMSETDARMSFERHATSKIKQANDLFKLHTKGFRGEALASIAAIAHVELKTKLVENQLGTRMVVEGSKVVEQQPCQCASGTSFAVKNLFFNVPARRNFLKSNPVEFKHILEEFHRLVLTHEGIQFQLFHNDEEIYQLMATSKRQRIVNVMGRNYNQRLAPVSESTDIVNVDGFVGKPEFAKKTRGEQYLFVNQRFIKSSYLNHAIQSTYDGLIDRKNHASYFLYITIDPEQIDINIHPTKTEIKFQDERSVYAIIHASVRQALGKHNLTPAIDFEQETSFNILPLEKGKEISPPKIDVDTSYDPFQPKSSGYKPNPALAPKWETLYEVNATPEPQQLSMEDNEEPAVYSSEANGETKQGSSFSFVHQLGLRYILTKIRSGLIIIDQRRAHQRVLYERFEAMLEKNQGPSQQQLFPETIELSAEDYHLLISVKEQLQFIGFDLEDFGGNSVIVRGMPVDMAEKEAKKILEEFLEQVKLNSASPKLSEREKLALSLAYSAALPYGKKMEVLEMQQLIDELFACQIPHYSPSGKPTIITFTQEDIERKFGN